MDLMPPPASHVLPQTSESSDLSDGPITVQEFLEVKSALNASEAKIQQLLKVNCHLSDELRSMQSKVCKYSCNRCGNRTADHVHVYVLQACVQMKRHSAGFVV